MSIILPIKIPQLYFYINSLLKNLYVVIKYFYVNNSSVSQIANKKVLRSKKTGILLHELALL